MIKINIASEQQTITLAEQLAKHAEHGDVLLLSGDLGAGKTVFSRALIRKSMNDSKMDVPSPTFTLLQIYDMQNPAIYHFDLYRLGNSDEIYEIGWEEALAEGIVIVEWPERLEGIVHTIDADKMLNIDINIDDKDNNARVIMLTPSDQTDTGWTDKLKQLDI